MSISWKSCLRLALTVLVSYLCIRYWATAEHFVQVALHAARPLLLGAVIAYILNILMSFYERTLPQPQRGKQLRRPMAMLLAFVTLMLVCVLLFRMILPELVNCLKLILDRLPGALRSGYNWLDKNYNISAYLTDQNLINTVENWNVKDTITGIVDFLISGVGGVMGSIVSGAASVFSGVATSFIAIVFAVYLLSGKERLGAQFTRLVGTYGGEKSLVSFRYFVKTFDHAFHSFIVGQCLEATILGTLCIIGMSLLQFPYAMMIGCLVGFTALIPIAGAYIGAAVGAFMIFTVNPLQALLFIVFLLVLQQVEGNLIYPKVVGASIGLPGILVLSAITIGGGIMGIGGMLIGVPLTAAFYQLLKNNVASREAARAVLEDQLMAEE